MQIKTKKRSGEQWRRKSIISIRARLSCPWPVLEKVQSEFLNFNSTGLSITEISHRSKTYEELHLAAEARLKKLLGLNDDYRCLFLQGGASTQFAMLPMNFLPPGGTADYLITGSWAKKAFQEASRLGKAHIAASTEGENFRRLPTGEINFTQPGLCHLTSNNTIMGTNGMNFDVRFRCGYVQRSTLPSF